MNHLYKQFDQLKKNFSQRFVRIGKAETSQKQIKKGFLKTFPSVEKFPKRPLISAQVRSMLKRILNVILTLAGTLSAVYYVKYTTDLYFHYNKTTVVMSLTQDMEPLPATFVVLKSPSDHLTSLTDDMGVCYFEDVRNGKVTCTFRFDNHLFTYHLNVHENGNGVCYININIPSTPTKAETTPARPSKATVSRSNSTKKNTSSRKAAHSVKLNTPVTNNHHNFAFPFFKAAHLYYKANSFQQPAFLYNFEIYKISKEVNSIIKENNLGPAIIVEVNPAGKDYATYVCNMLNTQNLKARVLITDLAISIPGRYYAEIGANNTPTLYINSRWLDK